MHHTICTNCMIPLQHGRTTTLHCRYTTEHTTAPYCLYCAGSHAQTLTLRQGHFYATKCYDTTDIAALSRACKWALLVLCRFHSGPVDHKEYMPYPAHGQKRVQRPNCPETGTRRLVAVCVTPKHGHVMCAESTFVQNKRGFTYGTDTGR